MSKKSEEIVKRAIANSKKKEVPSAAEEYDAFWDKIQNDNNFAAAISHLCKKDFFSYITTLYYLINCNKFMLCDFHSLIIKKLQDIVDGKNEKRNLALCLPVGCVSGDTVIRYNRGIAKQITIEEMFGMLNRNKKRGCGQKWSKKIRTYVRSYIEKDDCIKLNEIEKVTFSGYKDIYLLTLEDGKSIKATIDHRIMTQTGWKELGTLTTNDYVMVDLVGDRIKYNVKSYTSYGYSQVKNIEFIGRKKTYDIWCYNNHNFSANDIIVHNSGKSLLTEYFISWCFARTRDNAFVYTSHSEDLITKMSAEIRNICTSPQWVRLFGWKLRKDDRQKTNFSFEGAKNRTGLRAKAINSAITGLDAGHPAVDGFSGALICFPYEEKVWTNKGLIPIGEIVEKQLDVLVYSYNFKNNTIELQSIDNYITNPGDDIVEVKMQDGTSIKCTKNHKIWTKNRGYVEAKDLISGIDKVITFSNPFNLAQTESCVSNNDTSWIVFISNKIQEFFIQLYLFSWFIIYFTCKSFKRFASFNSLYRSYTTVKRFGNFSITSFIGCYFNYIFSGQFTPRKYECTDFNSILHIFGFSTISKIFKSIVRRIRIKMSNFHTKRSFSYKSQHNKLMNSDCFPFSIFKKLYDSITFSISSFKDSFWQKIATTVPTAIFNPMFKSFYYTCIRYLVTTFITRDVFVNNVSVCSHNYNSFCLTVHDNHNMFVGSSQGVLVKNCDDAMDAGNAIYEIERENVIRIYNEKLATRRRTAKTPTILIMQRLHPEDLVGWAERNQPELWDIVKVPALKADGTSFWEKRYPAEELQMLQKRQPELFMSQYQQNPVWASGVLIKKEWFKYYDQHPKYERIFVVADTSQTAKEYSDYSVFMVIGKFQQSLYLIDMIHEKLEIPDLIKKAKSLISKYKLWENRIMLSAMYIEDKSSGTALIQQLQREVNVPILPLKPGKKDKVTRVKDILYYLEAGSFYLPMDKEYGFNPTFLNEVGMFTADGSAKHDDIVDTLCYSCLVGLAGTGASIFD